MDLVPEHLVEVVNQRVTIRVLDKRGPRCRLSIEAPKHFHLTIVEDGRLENTPSDGVTLSAEQFPAQSQE